MDDRRYGAASNVQGIVNGQTVSNPYKEKQNKKRNPQSHNFCILLFTKLTSSLSTFALSPQFEARR